MPYESRPNSHSSRQTVTHPLVPGTPVTVFRFGLSKRPFIEGRAVIIRALPETDHFYLMKFDGERRYRRRFAHADFQSQPDRVLEALLCEWRASMTPELLEMFDSREEEEES